MRYRVGDRPGRDLVPSAGSVALGKVAEDVELELVRRSDDMALWTFVIVRTEDAQLKFPTLAQQSVAMFYG